MTQEFETCIETKSISWTCAFYLKNMHWNVCKIYK